MGRKTAFKSYRVGERAIVIGRGLAGLSAARVLSDRFREVVLLDRGLLPIGDAICRFNPIFGQGMTVAAQEADLLLDLLGTVDTDALDTLAPNFLTEAENLIAAPWTMSAIPDFIYPETTGERPKDLENRLNFQRGLGRLAVRDAAVFELLTEVRHLLKPLSLLDDPSIVRRIEEESPSASELLFQVRSRA